MVGYRKIGHLRGFAKGNPHFLIVSSRMAVNQVGTQREIEGLTAKAKNEDLTLGFHHLRLLVAHPMRFLVHDGLVMWTADGVIF